MTQTIEQTGKRWKAVQLVGGLVMVLGVGMCSLMPRGGDYEAQMTAGVGLLAIGLVVLIAGRLGAWWYHG